MSALRFWLLCSLVFVVGFTVMFSFVLLEWVFVWETPVGRALWFTVETFITIVAWVRHRYETI